MRGGYPIMIVPNMIAAAPANMVKWLSRISETYQVPVTSTVGAYSRLGQRQLRMAAGWHTHPRAQPDLCRRGEDHRCRSFTEFRTGETKREESR